MRWKPRSVLAIGALILAGALLVAPTRASACSTCSLEYGEFKCSFTIWTRTLCFALHNECAEYDCTYSPAQPLGSPAGAHALPDGEEHGPAVASQVQVVEVVPLPSRT